MPIFSLVLSLCRGTRRERPCMVVRGCRSVGKPPISPTPSPGHHQVTFGRRYEKYVGQSTLDKVDRAGFASTEFTCVCVHVYVYTYSAYMYVYTFAYMYRFYMWVCIDLRIWTLRLHVCVYISMYVIQRLHVCVGAFAYMYTNLTCVFVHFAV